MIVEDDIFDGENSASTTRVKANIDVFLKLRPMNHLEISKRSRNCIDVHEYEGIEGKTDITVDSPLDGEHEFNFDQVFDQYDSNESIYDYVASPMSAKFMKGYNCTLVAYGASKTGKTTLLLGDDFIETKKKEPSHEEAAGEKSARNDGMIPKLLDDIFQRMKESSQDIEFSIKISFFEIYLEQVRDLLHPSKRFLQIEDDDLNEKQRFNHCVGSRIDGLSEICCVSASDAVALLRKGQTCRVVSEERKQTDLSRSHSIVKVKIEQKNLITERIVKSTLCIVDASCSEVEEGVKENKRTLLTTPHSHQLEKTLSGRSHFALDNIVKTLGSGADSEQGRHVAFRGSKLTSVLSNAFGGNSFCTFVLTASPASINIGSTLATIRFGERLRRVTNNPVVTVQASPMDFTSELEKSRRIQSELRKVIEQIRDEIEYVGGSGQLTLRPELCDAVNEICSKDKAITEENANFHQEHTPKDLSAEEELRLEKKNVERLKKKFSDASDAREMAQKTIDNLQGECLFLRKENDDVLQAKKKNTIDLIDAQNEIQKLKGQKLEVEHNLRTSRFREHEAVVFLRHMRRFYRRLVENINAHGSGDIETMISHMAGAPDLSELTDIDTLLLESGLLEDYEIGEETDPNEYHPSTNSLLRSAVQANRAISTKPLQAPKSPSRAILQLESVRNAVNKSLSNSAKATSASNKFALQAKSGLSMRDDDLSYGSGNVVLHSEANHRSPSDKLTERTVEELENEVLVMTKRCIELQTSLNSAEEKLDIASTKRRFAKKINNSKEFLILKTSLEKKTADLEAVVWKMNELHLVNRSYNDKLSNRDQHIAYLEDSLRTLQEKNLRLVTVHIENEKKLRDEIERLKDVVDSLTLKLWQEGGAEVPLENRIMIPFQGQRYIADERRDGVDETVQNSRKVDVHYDNGGTDSNRISQSTSLQGVAINPEIDVAALCAGGKRNDYIAKRFTQKRGMLIKSATLTGTEGIPLASSEVNNESVASDSVDLATVRRQLANLDYLTKSWNERNAVSTLE